MNASARNWFRVFFVAAFVVGLYGGLGLLTAMMLVKGYLLIGLLSGLALAVMVACALALFGLAWSMSSLEGEDAQFGLVGQPAWTGTVLRQDGRTSTRLVGEPDGAGGDGGRTESWREEPRLQVQFT